MRCRGLFQPIALRVRHVVSKGVKADINNNLSERLQGTIRDRDKTLRGLKARDTGQAYVDGLVTHYNPVYFRPHESLKGKKPIVPAHCPLRGRTGTPAANAPPSGLVLECGALAEC